MRCTIMLCLWAASVALGNAATASSLTKRNNDASLRPLHMMPRLNSGPRANRRSRPPVDRNKRTPDQRNR